jgi:DegV family protein with EDD domain
MPRVRVVTDSTAMLPAELAVERGIIVVPLQVVIGEDVHEDAHVAGAEGGISSELVAAALRERTPVSTSRPSPAALLAVYEQAAREGADEVLSIHLSGDMSGTFESAQLAAREAPLPVLTVDSRQVGIATGFAVLAAADVLDAGGSAEEAAQAARARAEASSSLFYVHTLEHLRRGGRVGAAAALLGGALSVKPLLQIKNGRVATLEKVRTSARAIARLEELAVQAAADRQVDLCVAHLANPDRAAELVENLTRRLAENLDGREVWCGELGSVLGAHVGPGTLAVCVSPRV